jgi:hypothetical protein
MIQENKAVASIGILILHRGLIYARLKKRRPPLGVTTFGSNEPRFVVRTQP